MESNVVREFTHGNTHYQFHRSESGTLMLTETTRADGVTETHVYECIGTLSQREECFCCSCPPDSYNDPYCRAHGFAGLRPCDEHNMPGRMVRPEHWGGSGASFMPISVQRKRAGERDA